MATYRQGGVFGRIPRAGRPDFSMVFRANQILRLTDEITGAFRGGRFQRALEAAHTEAAQNIQKVSAQQLRTRKSRRPQVRTPLLGDDHEPGALEEAILHEKNRFVNASGFKVGIPAWLDQSPAEKYWRQIEQGAPERAAPGFFYGFNKDGRSMRSRANPRRAGLDARFLQGRGPMTRLGPFPAYRYGAAGATFGRFQNMLPIYSKHLLSYGFPVPLRRKG